MRTPQPEPRGRASTCASPSGRPRPRSESQVIWINPPREDGEKGRQAGMGLKFVDLTPGQRDQILRLVRTFAYLDDEAERVGNS